MSGPDTSYRCHAWQPLPRVAVEVAFGLPTAARSSLVRGGSPAPARLLSTSQSHLSRRCTERGRDGARLINRAGMSVLSAPRKFGDRDAVALQTVADGVGCRNGAAPIRACRRGEVAVTGVLRTGPCR